MFGSIDEGMELVVDLLAGICEVVQDGEHTAAHQDLFRQSKDETGFLDCKGGCNGTGSTPCLLDLLTA